MLCIAIPYCLSIIPFLSAVPSFSFAFVLPFLSFLFNFFRAFPFSVSYFIPSVPFHLSVVIWRKSLSCFYKMSFFKSHVTFLLFFWVCHLRFRSLYMYILLIFLFQPFWPHSPLKVFPLPPLSLSLTSVSQSEIFFFVCENSYFYLFLLKHFHFIKRKYFLLYFFGSSKY